MKILKILPYILIAFLLYRIVSLNKQNTILIDKTATLEENLKNKTVIYKDKIVYKERVDTVSGTEIKQQTVYVPYNGYINILTPEEGQKLDLNLYDKLFNHAIKQEDGSIILIKDKGFTFSPSASLIYTNKLEIGIQSRFLFYKRYGVGMGITNKYMLYTYIDRNVSDIINLFKNTNMQLTIGKDLENGKFKLGVGINVNF